MAEEIMRDADDNVQHGIDDDPNNDGKKGLELGGLGGGAVGAIAGAAAGPVGAVVGALIGGSVGAVASGAAVDAVDAVDNDDTITGIGSGQTRDVGDQAADVAHAHGVHTHTHDVVPGNNVPGIQTGGTTEGGAPDTRGITEKAADAVTGDNMDDKTGRRVD